MCTSAVFVPARCFWARNETRVAPANPILCIPPPPHPSLLSIPSPPQDSHSISIVWVTRLLYPEPVPKPLPLQPPQAPTQATPAQTPAQTSSWAPAAQKGAVILPIWASPGCDWSVFCTKTPAPLSNTPASCFSPKHLCVCGDLVQPYPSAAQNLQLCPLPTHLSILRQYLGPRTAHASPFCPNTSACADCSWSGPKTRTCSS